MIGPIKVDEIKAIETPKAALYHFGFKSDLKLHIIPRQVPETNPPI